MVKSLLSPTFPPQKDRRLVGHWAFPGFPVGNDGQLTDGGRTGGSAGWDGARHQGGGNGPGKRAFLRIMSWQCVKTNSTPSVHIKIAGIYGCSSHYSNGINRYWSIPSCAGDDHVRPIDGFVHHFHVEDDRFYMILWSRNGKFPSGWWFETMEFWMTFHILGIMIPTDELILFRRVETTNQFWMGMGEWDDYWKLLWIIPSFPTTHK